MSPPGTMQAVRVTGRRQAGLADRPIPQVRGNYVLLAVRAAPMCNEYLAYTDGVYLERNRPDSLGHEMAGEVVAAPESASVRVGDRVVALCGYPCGRCRECLRGYYAHCGATEDPREVCGSESGECGFAQYAVKPDWMLVPIPAGLSYDHASMACCGLGPTFGAMQRMGVDAFGTVLVTGLGAVGLGGIINAKYRGATVIGVARSPYRAELAKRLGCDVVLDPATDDVAAAVADLTGGRGADYALECSGQPEYQRLLVDSVGRLGTVAFLAEPGELSLHIDRDLVQKGVTLLGTLDVNRRDSDLLMRMIQQVPEQIETFVTHRLPLAEAQSAFELQASRECGKVILHPWSD